jgi:serine/threonine-protein kinase
MEGRKRFEREAKMMARLEHPHCVSIIDYGIHGEKPYVVMELVRGRSLFELLDDHGRMEIPRAVDVMRQVLSGLAHAHEQGIIHRDIKPANIMVTPKAPLGLHVRILDFGLARMLGASASVSNGVAVGTPSYMAPEQCRGESLDARVDVYACGVVLFEMLTGRKPFVARDPIAIVKKQIEDAPPRLSDVTPGRYGALEDVVARALAKKPEDRYPSAVAMAEALDAAVSGRSVSEPTIQLPVDGKSGESEGTVQLGADELKPASASVNVPITVGSSVMVKPQKPGSSIRRMLPVSRTRWLVLALLLVAASAGAAAYVFRDELGLVPPEPPPRHAPPPVIVHEPAPVPVPMQPMPVDPATELANQAAQLAAAGTTQAAIESLVKARQVYPDDALLAVTLGKLYMNKMWWDDGVRNLRDALKLDPKLRDDQELQRMALRAFLTTPGYDSRLAQLVLDIGPAMGPLLDEAAKSHPSPDKRSRATALRTRLH